MLSPKLLKKGSKVAVVAPARAVDISEIESALSWLSEKGFEAVYDNRLFKRYHQFAGDDEDRASLLQEYLDSEYIDAILCARGGYGTIRIVDRLNFEGFIRHPKWIIGYSDITVLHAKLQNIGFMSLHATMPINFKDNSSSSLETLFKALTTEKLIYTVDNHYLDIKGQAEAEIVGGNISVLYSMLGSDIFPDTEGKILFLEDVDEYLYHIDRMMFAMERAKVMKGLKALIVGGLTMMHDNTIRFGQSAEEIIAEKMAPYGIPVCFGFPAGHINDNRALILGKKAKLIVDDRYKTLEF